MRRRDAPRLEPTHVVIALLAGILYLLRRHSFHTALRPILIYPLRIPPHLFWYNVELDLYPARRRRITHCSANLLFELFTPLFVVQKHPRIAKVVVELLLYAAHARYSALDFGIACEHQDDCIFTRRVVQDGVLAAGIEGRIDWG